MYSEFSVHATAKVGNSNLTTRTFIFRSVPQAPAKKLGVCPCSPCRLVVVNFTPFPYIWDPQLRHIILWETRLMLTFFFSKKSLTLALNHFLLYGTNNLSCQLQRGKMRLTIASPVGPAIYVM